VEISKISKYATSFSGPSLFHEKTQERKREDRGNKVKKVASLCLSECEEDE